MMAEKLSGLLGVLTLIVMLLVWLYVDVSTRRLVKQIARSDRGDKTLQSEAQAVAQAFRFKIKIDFIRSKYEYLSAVFGRKPARVLTANRWLKILAIALLILAVLGNVARHFGW